MKSYVRVNYDQSNQCKEQMEKRIENTCWARKYKYYSCSEVITFEDILLDQKKARSNLIRCQSNRPYATPTPVDPNLFRYALTWPYWYLLSVAR